MKTAMWWILQYSKALWKRKWPFSTIWFTHFTNYITTITHIHHYEPLLTILTTLLTILTILLTILTILLTILTILLTILTILLTILTILLTILTILLSILLTILTTIHHWRTHHAKALSHSLWLTLPSSEVSKLRQVSAGDENVD